MTKTKYPLHPTRNNLHSNTKTVVIQLLNARLADGLDIAEYERTQFYRRS